MVSWSAVSTMFLWIQTIWVLPLVVAASSSGDNNNNVQRSFRILSRKFPDIMSEFAFHPTNPNVLATISGATSKVFLFTKDALLEEAGTEDEDKVMTASFADTVGNMPTSMVFKTTSTGQTFLIVGCGHDDHLYIFLLDNETDGAMQLHQSLAISGGSVSFMTASHNSKDPFVYYNFVPDDGPGYHPRSLGAIRFDSDASTWNDLGVVPLPVKGINNMNTEELFLVPTRSFISYDGMYLYNNAQYGLSALSSFLMTSNSTSSTDDEDAFWNSLDVPNFEMNYCQNHDDSFYLGAFPDPSGKWVAAQDYFLPAGLFDPTEVSDPDSLFGLFQGCPYESIEAKTLITKMLDQVSITSYNNPSNGNNPALGFGFRQLRGCCQVPQYYGEQTELSQVAAVHMSSDTNLLGKVTSHNISIPIDLLRPIQKNPYSRLLNDFPVGGPSATGEYFDEEDGGWIDGDGMDEEEGWDENDDYNYDNGNELFDVEIRLELFSNFNGDDLWLAMGNKLAYTSYGCFLGSDDGGSADLDLQVDHTEFHIHQANVAKFTFDSSSNSLSLEDLPADASYDATTQELRWTPKPEQVGEHTIYGRITSQESGSGASSCDIAITLSASVPSLTLTHSVDRLSLSEDGSALIAWTTQQDGSYSDDGSNSPSNLTLVELAGETKQSTKTLGYSVSQAFVGKNMLVLFEKGCTQIHLLERSTLDELKSMPNPTVVNRYNCDSYQFFSVKDGALRMCNNPGYCDSEGYAAYDINGEAGELSEIDIVRPYNQVPDRGQSYVEGFLKKGILYDHLDRSKELLVLDPGPFFVGSISFQDAANNDRYYIDQPIAYKSPYEFLHAINNPTGQQMMEVPGSGVMVVYELGRHVYNNEGFQIQNSTLTVIDHNGHVLEKGTFFSHRFGRNEQRHYSYNENRPVVSPDGELFVGFSNRVYRWKWDGRVESQPEAKGFHFVDQQSKFYISPSATKEELSFELRGGVGPFDLYLQYSTNYNSDLLKSLIKVDDTASTLYVDGKAFHKEAVQVMVSFGARNGVPEVHSASLKDVLPWSLMTEENGEGTGDIPVSLPVFLHAVDSRGEKASLEYYVYTSVAYDDLPTLIDQALKDAQKNATSTGDSAFDKRDLEIMLLIALVVLLTIILGCLSCLVVWKVFINKEKTEILNEAEVDGLIKTDDGEAESETSPSESNNDDALSSTAKKPNTEIV